MAIDESSRLTWQQQKPETFLGPERNSVLIYSDGVNPNAEVVEL